MGVMERVSRKLAKLLCPPFLIDEHQQQYQHQQQQLQHQTNRRAYSSRQQQQQKELVAAAANSRLPIVKFHHVHGENVRLSQNGFVATRSEGFCKGIVFSNRTILPNERVYIKLVGVSTLWSGTVRFGFTSEDPAMYIASNLPKYVCPDMTATGKTWAKAINDQVAQKNCVIHFSYSTDGTIHYGINNQDCGNFKTTVQGFKLDFGQQKLWFVIDIYGNTTSIELLDPRRLTATATATTTTPSQIDCTNTLNCTPSTSPYKPFPLSTTPATTTPVHNSSIYSRCPIDIVGQTSLNNDDIEPTIQQQQDNQRKRRRTRRTTANGITITGRHNVDRIGGLFGMRFGGANNSNVTTTIMDNPVTVQQNIYSPSPMALHNTPLSGVSTNVSTTNQKISTRKPLATITNNNNNNNNKQKHSKNSSLKDKENIKIFSTKDEKRKSSNPRSDCLICFERPIDCVFIQCGHMCTCYQCGVKQFRSQSRTCPICRTNIKEVIKTYMA